MPDVSTIETHVNIYAGLTKFRNPRQPGKGGPQYRRRELVEPVTGEVKEYLEPIRRGEISGFSRSSRRRLMGFLFSLDQFPTSFLTLTYPRHFSADASEWKRHLDVFAKRMARKFPNSWWVWKLEPQKRGAPHYHLLGTFGVVRNRDSLRYFRKWVAETWAEIVGATGDERRKHLLAGTQCDFLPDTSKKMIMHYIAKYQGKNIEMSELPAWSRPGRFWGVIGRKNVKLQSGVIELTGQQFEQLRRLVIKWSARICPDYSRRLSKMQNFFVFINPATMLRMVKYVCGEFRVYDSANGWIQRTPPGPEFFLNALLSKGAERC